MEKQSAWINDILTAMPKNRESISILECCGRGCAIQNGHLEGMKPLQETARACSTRSERIAFMKETFPFDVEEVSDGILIRFHKEGCTCPMAPKISNPMLCYCTQGHEKAMWSELFGKDIDAEIVESFQRGGNDCVIKLFV